MLDRDVVEQFLNCKLADIEMPADIDRAALVEAFFGMSRTTTTNGSRTTLSPSLTTETLTGSG